MERDEKADKKELLRFALLMDKHITKDNKSITFMQAGNTGVPIPEIIAYIETWLEMSEALIRNLLYFSEQLAYSASEHLRNKVSDDHQKLRF